MYMHSLKRIMWQAPVSGRKRTQHIKNSKEDKNVSLSRPDTYAAQAISELRKRVRKHGKPTVSSTRRVAKLLTPCKKRGGNSESEMPEESAMEFTQASLHLLILLF